MKSYTVKTSYGMEKVWLTKERYGFGGRLCVQMWSEDGPFATLTVNLPVNGEKLGMTEKMAFVDVNNCPWAKEFIAQNKLGRYMGIDAESGYCRYPLYIFHDNIFS